MKIVSFITQPHVSIYMNSKGRTPVDILSSPAFDAPNQIDKTSLTFGRTGNEQSLAFCTAGTEDVDSDGHADQICHFNTEQTGFKAGDTVGVLKRRTVAGAPSEEPNSVRIVPIWLATEQGECIL